MSKIFKITLDILSHFLEVWEKIQALKFKLMNNNSMDNVLQSWIVFTQICDKHDSIHLCLKGKKDCQKKFHKCFGICSKKQLKFEKEQYFLIF